MKAKITRGTEVIVIAGEHKSKTGKVLHILENNRVVVEGVNIRKKCVKKSQANPNGGIIEVELPIHYSNIALFDKSKQAKEGKASAKKSKAKS